MADVLTIDDLIADKKHSTFFAEVITGKTGGVSGGADISTSANQVTGQVQKTLPQVLADLGMVVQTWTASSGGTLTNAAQVFLNDKAGSSGLGNYYAWSGPFPKVVTSGLDPAITAGFITRSDAGLRSQLSSTDGAGIIGSMSYAQLRAYSGPQASVNVWGISNAFDGAAGLFKVKTSDTTSADNGGTILVDASGRRWYRVFNDAIKPEWFGAIGDGATDNTVAIQNAVNFLNSIGGGELNFGIGTYIIKYVDLYSNITISGNGWGTILAHPSGFNGRKSTTDPTWPWEVDGMFTANFGGLAGTSNIADNIKNITFKNIWFKGTTVTDGFLETLNLLCLTAVSNVSITGCKFTGFRGDAIDFPTGSILHGDNERHCSNLYIANNYFDGLNFNNRQAISIYDCIGALIENNYFTNCTRSDMPGAIDLEPGGAISPNMLNITIRNNRFVAIGISGDKPGVACLLPAITDQSKIGNIQIYENLFKSNMGVQLLGTNTTSDLLQREIITVRDNDFIGVTRGVVTSGLYGVDFLNNKFQSISSSMLLGNSGSTGNLSFKGNTFQYCAYTDGLTVLMYSVNGLSFRENTFIDCGKNDGTSGDVLYSLGGSAVSNLSLKENKFWKNGVQMHQVVRNADGAIDRNTLRLSDNELVGDVVLGFSQKSTSYGTYTNAPNGTAVSLFALEQGTYHVSVDVVGDASNFGAFATVVVGASSTRIVASNTSFVTLAVSGGYLKATQISGGDASITWSYDKTQHV